MIRQLKKKIIIINMSIVSVILLALFISICVITYKVQTEEAFRLLEASLVNDNKIPPREDFNSPPAQESELPHIYTVKVTLNSENQIINISNAGIIDTSFLADDIEDILNSEKESGRIGKTKLMYLKRALPNGTVIVLTSTEGIDNFTKNTILISLALMAVSLLLFFILSERLAHFATMPVNNAWQNQKQFVSDASHDLKTPLTVILANNDILLSHKDSTIEEQKKWIEGTNEEAMKMKSLVEQMLDLAKSENLNDRLVFKNENLSEATEGAILQLEPIAYEKNVLIDAKISPDIAINTCISSYLRIAQTLLDNAIKYSLNGDRVLVELKDDRQKVILHVNNASYIEPEDLKHIFERFYRADKSRNESGHGLGLAIAKNLAIKLGGDLGVKSSREYGTSFALILKK